VTVVAEADFSLGRGGAKGAAGSAAAGGFDRVLANPPYFGDLRIARDFCSKAWTALRKGGDVALVVRRGKASDANAEVLSDVFGRVTTIDAGDYAILTARR
jgi:16S rRNA G1207 methylase RsmC